MLNVIISEKLYDERFVDKWTTGFTQLKEHVKQYSPEAMEKVTWVPAETIRQAALMYARNKPASIYKGNATALQVNGFQGYRAFMLLPALTGGVDVAGGCVIPMKIPLNNLRLPTTFADRPIGAREHPLYVDQWREAQALLFSDAILTGKPYPIEAMIVAGANPALLWANSSKTRRALEALKFLVVIDTVMSETAKLADLVLPAGSFLERTELRDYGQTSVTDGVPYVMLRKKVITLWECRPDLEIVFAMARKMGYSEQFPWNTAEEAIDYLLQPSGITVKQLIENPSGFATYEMKYGKYEQDGFRTPSKKIELYSRTLEKYGYDPLPTHREAEVDQDTVTRYPLTLSSGGRILEYTHSQHRNIPKLSKRVPEPWVEIHPDTARSYGINQGDPVRVETKIGHITVKAKITDAILPSLIHVPHAWIEADVNLLITDEVRDPVTGFPAMKSTPCQIKRTPVLT
jgi:anaerobic selenocysteine-containing dehydrogenase